MKPERISPHRAAIMIVSGIVNMLRVESGEKPLEQAGAVVTFPYVLRIVVQGAVADDEVESAAAEIKGVDSRNPRDGQFRRQRILGSAPLSPRNGNSAAGEAVDCGKGEIFGLAVVPAEASEHTDVVHDFLFHVDPEAVLQC